MLTDPSGNAHMVATVSALQQVSFAPDGALLLWRTPAGFTVHALAGGADFSWPEPDTSAIPWWAPDSQSILIRTATELTLVSVADRQARLLARVPAGPANTGATSSEQLHPITGSPWSPDGSQFALVAAGGQWFTGGSAASSTPAMGTTLAVHSGGGTGLYICDLAGAPAPPLADWGEHTGLSWSTPDPNTQFMIS
jgi:hypothetical protein